MAPQEFDILASELERNHQALQGGDGHQRVQIRNQVAAFEIQLAQRRFRQRTQIGYRRMGQ
jgi:hypothetical protein